MHELSIAMSIVDLAAEEAERKGYSEVTAVHVRIGKLSGVVKEALESAYELAREGTMIADSKLVIEEVPVSILCPTCKKECRVESITHLCCSLCGTPSADIVSGRELEVSALEIVQ